MSNVELKLKSTVNDNDIYDIYIDNVYAGGLEANYDPRINSFYIENIKKSDDYKSGHLLEDVVNYLYNDKGYDLGCLPLEKYRGYYEELGFTPFAYNNDDVYYHKIHKDKNMKTDEFLTELKNIINEDLNNTMWEFTAPWFPGFYEGSIYYPDNVDEYELFNNPNNVPETILDWCKDNADIEDWDGYKREVCESYINNMNEVMSEIIPNFNAEFVDMDSPSDYNYGNDRCFGKINWNSVKEDVLDYINNNRDTFKEYIKQRFSDRPGFWSNYDSDADKWDLEGELDHNELGTLFGFILYDSGKIKEDDFRANVCYDVYPHWDVNLEELKQNFKFDVEPKSLEDLENYVYDSNTDTYKRSEEPLE